MPVAAVSCRATSMAAALLLLGAGCSSVPNRGAAVHVRRSSWATNPSVSPKIAGSSALRGDAGGEPTESADSSPRQETSEAPAPNLPVITQASASDDGQPQSSAPEAAIASAASAQELTPTADTPPEQPVTGYTLTLANVLYLADAQNPNVAFARARIDEAYARVDRAEALWLPSIRAGLNYNHHEGNQQDSAGNIINVNRSSLYGGFGAGAIGTGSPAFPGLVAQFHLADAAFQPKIAAHQAASRQFAATATRNDTLRNTAVAYLELIRAEQALAVAEEALANTQKLANLTGEYARTGQGLRADHERMLAELAIREAEIEERLEGVDVASARLAQLLHADSSVRIHSGEPMVVPLDVLAVESSAAEYVATGLSRRPELAEQKHLVCEAVERLRREKYAPLVPSVLLGLSYGGMGGGTGNSIINTNDRWDADAIAFWELRNLGIGERSARDETTALVEQAQMRELAVLDLVAREVVEAHTQVLKRHNRIDKARESIRAAERSYELNSTRIRNVQGLPIEVLQSVQALALARSTYLNAVIDYNIAQFELCRATGWFE